MLHYNEANQQGLRAYKLGKKWECLKICQTSKSGKVNSGKQLTSFFNVLIKQSRVFL